MKTGTIATIALGITALWLISLGITFLVGVEDASKIGDAFGGVNALFSGMALCFVAIAIILQKKQLELQYQELVSTRGELQRTADAQERTARIAERTSHINALSALLASVNLQIQIASAEGPPSAMLAQALAADRKRIEAKLKKLVMDMELYAHLMSIIGGEQPEKTDAGSPAPK